MNTTIHPARFSSTFDIEVYIRPADGQQDWQVFDHGPGIFHIPPGHEVMVRVRRMDDHLLRELVSELTGLPFLTTLNLSENRNVTDTGLAHLHPLTHLTSLNLSSCGITDSGLAHLCALPHLESLNLAYCNRLTDACLKHIRAMPRLRYLDLLGCLSITHAGLSRLGRRDLTIHR